MADLYHFPHIDGETAVYGVAADPVAHSMSPAIHNAAFEACGVNAVYLPLKVARPRPFLDAYERLGLRGLSVTIPHKQTMLELMDEVEDTAGRLGAINTVCICGGVRYGYNTDLDAAVDAIEDLVLEAGLGPLEGCRVMIVGAGGAARAIAYGLTEQVQELIIANRTTSRAEELAEELGVEWCGLDDMTDYRPDVVVNATSVGMHPDVEQSPVPTEMLRPGMAVFDSVYNPPRTRLLKDARQAGAEVAGGLNWFVGQAAAQFKLWTGHKPPWSIMEETVRNRLEG
jgi:3-dehydroquinate dehydratase/shikimate dehydrogenase